MDLPLSTLLDMICIEQIKNEGFRYKSMESGASEILDMYKRLK